jgi:hypothetical protein
MIYNVMIYFSFLSAVFAPKRAEWGFYAHQQINRTAVFTLPPEMISFYKQHIAYLTEKAVNPDMRRYVNPDEAARHYIDLDVYGDSALYKLPRYWSQAVEMYTEDTLKKYGIVPWHIEKIKFYLIRAFQNHDTRQVLRLSADLGHYIGDAHVPLHTTENYNGQLTGQYGIHGFWESRLPELFFDDYDLFTGRAEYLENTQLAIWGAVASAHIALDSVLQMEKQLDRDWTHPKFSYEERNGRTVRVFSLDYSRAYHDRLGGMVERQMKRAIRLTGSIWYTCWVEAGQPDLSEFPGLEEDDEFLPPSARSDSTFRQHESGE